MVLGVLQDAGVRRLYVFVRGVPLPVLSAKSQELVVA
jgi:hypothetical protein